MIQETKGPVKIENNVDFDSLPKFLGIGVQKGGTTWLHHMLQSNPQICMPSKYKELMFFDVEKNYKKYGIEGYKSFFELHKNHKVLGEITPGYLWSSPYMSEKYEIGKFRQYTPQRVYNCLGSELKLIVLLRNPVKRAISAFLHHMFKDRIKVGDSILNAGVKMGIIHMGFYAHHLFHWMEYYPLQSFKISIYENVTKDKSLFLQEVFNFLEVNEDYDPSLDGKQYQKKFDYKEERDGIYIIHKNQEIKVIDKDEILKLYEIFDEEIRNLENLFNLDVTPWKTAYI